MNAEETLKIISKQWCNIDDFKKLSQLGINNSFQLREKIKLKLEEKGYLIPKGLLPMNEVVKYLNIDIDYLVKISNIRN